MKRLTLKFKEAVLKLEAKELDTIIKRFLSEISDEDKRKFVIDLSRTTYEIYDFIEYEYTDAYDTFFKTKEGIEAKLKIDTSQIRFPQSELALAITQSIKLIDEFMNITLSQRLEITLHVFLLKIVFDNHSSLLGTPQTVLDNKIAVTLRKTINLIRKNRPPKLWNEYAVDIDSFLDILKKESGHLKSVSALPDTLLEDEEEDDELD
jgi:hypothetical protein